MRAAFGAAGLALIALGWLRIRVLRAWEPEVRPEEYRPGPDLFDWAAAFVLLAAGIGALVLAVMLRS